MGMGITVSDRSRIAGNSGKLNNKAERNQPPQSSPVDRPADDVGHPGGTSGSSQNSDAVELPPRHLQVPGRAHRKRNPRSRHVNGDLEMDEIEDIATAFALTLNDQDEWDEAKVQQSLNVDELSVDILDTVISARGEDLITRARDLLRLTSHRKDVEVVQVFGGEIEYTVGNIQQYWLDNVDVEYAEEFDVEKEDLNVARNACTELDRLALRLKAGEAKLLGRRSDQEDYLDRRAEKRLKEGLKPIIPEIRCSLFPGDEPTKHDDSRAPQSNSRQYTDQDQSAAPPEISSVVTTTDDSHSQPFLDSDTVDLESTDLTGSKGVTGSAKVSTGTVPISMVRVLVDGLPHVPPPEVSSKLIASIGAGLSSSLITCAT